MGPLAFSAAIVDTGAAMIIHDPERVKSCIS
jgi:hypothetical protein